MIAAVLPAAGLSRRMGQPKLALPFAGRTVLEHVVVALRRGGVDRVVVVLGPHVADLAPVAGACGAEVVSLAEPTTDMRATVEHGLAYLEATQPPAAWFLVPADHPTLSADIPGDLLQARQLHPGCSIFVPTWQGRRGHPTLIAWSHVAGIRAHPAGEGLNRYLRRYAAATLEVPARSAAVVEDLDTPEDHARLLRSMGDQAS